MMITVYYNNVKYEVSNYFNIKWSELYRDNDLPVLVNGNTKYWYKNGKRHLP
jgi:hypothetical protein